MTLLRIPLNSRTDIQNSLDAIVKLKGYYGIECISLTNEVELFLFIEDKHINKVLLRNDQEQLFLYLNSFGIHKDDFDNVEILDNRYLKENFLDFNIVLKGYFDFTNLSLLNFQRKNSVRNYNTNSQLKNQEVPSQESNQTNLLTNITKYLWDLKLNFFIQFFSKFDKKNYFTSGQILIFTRKENYSFMVESIKEKLQILTKNWSLKFKVCSKLNPLSGIKLKDFLSHHPFKYYLQVPLIVNELLKIPNLASLWSHSYQFNDLKPSLEIKDLEDGIPIGFKLIPGLKYPSVVKLSFEELTSHFCSFGITSQGKSRLMYNFLSFVDKTAKKFLVIDPKGEYFEALSSTNNMVEYYKVGSLEFPLMINIFSVPKGLSADNHIQFIYSLLLSIMGDDITPQMNRLLFKTVEYVIYNNGTMKNFTYLLEHPEKLNVKGSYLEASGNAVLNRILPLIIGPTKNCFMTKVSNIDFSDLSVKNVIIDLSIFELVESTISRKVFVNTFLHYFIHAIRLKNSSIRKLGDITNFILLEEIQKIAPLTYQGKNEVNSFIGLAPWTVRAYGISMGFIGTDPNVESPIITNTGLSMIFYSKSNIQNVLKLLGIPYNEYMSYLKDLQERKIFLLCYKGKMTLIKAFDFVIPDGIAIKTRYDQLLAMEKI